MTTEASTMGEASEKYIGQNLTPVELTKLVAGRGTFVADLRLANMAHAAVLRSARAHARITRIDVSPALKLDGVLLVLTASDVKDRIAPFPDSFEIHPKPWLDYVKPILKGPRAEVLAYPEVHYVGEPVAVVVARDRYIAEDAIDAIEVQYEDLPAVLDPEAALKKDAPRAHESADDNIVFQFTMSKGDVDRAFGAAAHTLKERYRHHRYCGAPMEGRGVVAYAEPKTAILTVWSSTQVPHMVRRQIATQLGLPEGQIRVIAPNIGGGFGPKVFVYPEDILIPYLALRLGRPVKWVEDRREHFISTAHGRDQLHDVEVGFDAEGRILGLRDRFVLDNGAYNPMGLTDAYNTAAHLQGPYRIPSLRITGTCVATNKVPNAPYRGAGRPEAVFVMERLIDRIARHLGLDPAEVRRRNFIAPGEMPYDAGIMYRDGAMVRYDSGDFPRTLGAALAAAGYEELRRRQQSLRTQGRYVGVGIGCYVEGTGVGSFEGARIQIDPSGRILVATGATAHGQTHETVFSQITADLWGVDPSRVMLIEGDTAAIPFGCGTFGSRSTVNVGMAIHEASQKLKAKVLRAAAEILEANPEDLEIAGGSVFVRGMTERAVSLAELARVGAPGWASELPEGMSPGLEESHYYVPPTVTWAHAVHVAVIEVDTRTGEIDLSTYVVAHDSGRLVNPMLVEGQVHGGVAQGIGGALYEEIAYDDAGQLLTGSFMNYLVPGAMEVPTIRTVHLESPSPLNPLGVKGLGEGGSIAPPAAIANALVDALAPFGVEVNEIPLKPALVLELAAKPPEKRGSS